MQPQTIAEWSEKIAAYRIQASPLQYQLKGLHDCDILAHGISWPLYSVFGLMKAPPLR